MFTNEQPCPVRRDPQRPWCFKNAQTITYVLPNIRSTASKRKQTTTATPPTTPPPPPPHPTLIQHFSLSPQRKSVDKGNQCEFNLMFDYADDNTLQKLFHFNEGLLLSKLTGHLFNQQPHVCLCRTNKRTELTQCIHWTLNQVSFRAGPTNSKFFHRCLNTHTNLCVCAHTHTHTHSHTEPCTCAQTRPRFILSSERVFRE